MNVPNETGIIYLRDLPKDKIYVDLNKNFKLYILNKAKDISGNWINLGKDLNLEISKKGKCKTLECIKENKRFRIGTLLKIIDFLKDNKIWINEKIICDNIEVLSTRHNKGPNKLTNSIYKPRLPIDFNTEYGGTLVAAFLGDGGIDKDLKPNYNNNEIILKRKVYESFCSVFGFVSGKARNFNNQQIYFPKVAGIILTECLGMKSGRKTQTNPKVPDFLLNGSSKVKSSFLQHLYDDEGTVYFKKNDSQREIVIKFANRITEDVINHKAIQETNDEKYAPNLIKDTKSMIEGFGIKATKLECVEIYKTKVGDYNTKWTFHIRKKHNLYLFMSNINFHLKRKREKLLRAYNSFHDFEKIKAERIENILLGCREIELNQEDITSRSLALKFNKSQSWSKIIIRNLRKTNYLLLKKPKHGIIGAQYILA